MKYFIWVYCHRTALVAWQPAMLLLEKCGAVGMASNCWRRQATLSVALIVMNPTGAMAD